MRDSNDLPLACATGYCWWKDVLGSFFPLPDAKLRGLCRCEARVRKGTPLEKPTGLTALVRHHVHRAPAVNSGLFNGLTNTVTYDRSESTVILREPQRPKNLPKRVAPQRRASSNIFHTDGIHPCATAKLGW